MTACVCKGAIAGALMGGAVVIVSELLVDKAYYETFLELYSGNVFPHKKCTSSLKVRLIELSVIPLMSFVGSAAAVVVCLANQVAQNVFAKAS